MKTVIINTTILLALSLAAGIPVPPRAQTLPPPLAIEVLETIEAQPTLPLEWKIHLIKAGTYALLILGVTPSSPIPPVSTIIPFTVAPKRNLNPGHVLPVALGTLRTDSYSLAIKL